MLFPALTEAQNVFPTTGNVGIETTSPSDKLDVNGNLFVFGGPNGMSVGVDVSTGYTVKSNNIKLSPVDYRTVRFDCSTIDLTGGWEFYNSSTAKSLMYVRQSGNIGIGTTNPQSLLAVSGNITAKQVTVTQTGWSDFVFDSSYQKLSLEAVSKYITENKHLPAIPSALELEEEGLDLGAMEKLHMQKIEELTLYAIDADRHAKEQDTLISDQQKILLQLRDHLQVQQKLLTTQQQQLEGQQKEIEQLKQKINGPRLAL